MHCEAHWPVKQLKKKYLFVSEEWLSLRQSVTSSMDLPSWKAHIADRSSSSRFESPEDTKSPEEPSGGKISFHSHSYPAKNEGHVREANIWSDWRCGIFRSGNIPTSPASRASIIVGYNRALYGNRKSAEFLLTTRSIRESMLTPRLMRVPPPLFSKLHRRNTFRKLVSARSRCRSFASRLGFMTLVRVHTMTRSDRITGPGDLFFWSIDTRRTNRCIHFLR